MRTHAQIGAESMFPTQASAIHMTGNDTRIGKKDFDVCDGCEFRSHDLQCHKLTRFQLRQSVVA